MLNVSVTFQLPVLKLKPFCQATLTLSRSFDINLLLTLSEITLPKLKWFDQNVQFFS